MNKYTVDIESQGDNMSATVRENGHYVKSFFGKDVNDLLEKAKNYADFLRKNPLEEETIWKEGDKKIVYYKRGIQEYMALFDGNEVEARTIVDDDGHIWRNFSEALNELKSFEKPQPTIQTIDL